MNLPPMAEASSRRGLTPTRIYGWTYTHGYSVLTPEELEQVRNKKQEQGLN